MNTQLCRLALIALTLVSARSAFASPQTACREEALASGQQAIESRFEGNERLTADLQVRSQKIESGFRSIVIGNSEDYHREADVIPSFVTTVTIMFDESCSEVARTIAKK